MIIMQHPPLGTNFNEIGNKIQPFSYNKNCLQMAAILSRPQCDNRHSKLKGLTLWEPIWGEQRGVRYENRDRTFTYNHNDVIKWKQFPRYCPFVRGIHRSPVDSLHKGQWPWDLMFSLTCVWTNGWVNNRDLRRHRAHDDVTVRTTVIATDSTIKFSWNMLRIIIYRLDFQANRKTSCSDRFCI